MDVQLIKKLAIEIENCGFEVAAIEMSPAFHLQLIHQNQNPTGDLDTALEHDIDRSVCNLPILFAGVDSFYYKLLNNQQYRERQKLNDLLRIYAQKYTNFKLLANHQDKMQHGEVEQIKLLETMRDLVLRINQSEQKIKLLAF